MSQNIDWAYMARGLLEAELERRQMDYGELVDRLKRFGIHETEASVREKIAQARFTAIFFLQCLIAIGVHSIQLAEL